MTNAAAALPPLPSVRAKELESRASELSQRHASTENADDKNAQYEQTEMGEKPSNSLNEKNTQSNREASTLVAGQQHRERLKQIEILHQKEQTVFDQLPPLDPTVTCDAIHQYMSSTSQFLNSYIADANASLEGTSHKLSVLEKQISLLESKLVSIPGLFPENDQEQRVDASAQDNSVAEVTVEETKR